MKTHGKLLIDESAFSEIAHYEWKSLLTDTKIRVYALGQPQTGRLIVCEYMMPDIVFPNSNTLWLVGLQFFE